MTRRRVTLAIALAVTMLYLAVSEVEPIGKAMLYLLIAAWCLYAVAVAEGR